MRAGSIPASAQRPASSCASSSSAAARSRSPSSATVVASAISPSIRSSFCAHRRRRKTPFSSEVSASLGRPVRGQRDAVGRVDLAVLDRVEQTCGPGDFDRLLRQPQLLGAAPAQAGDQRQVRDRRHADDPLLGRGRDLGRLRQPALGLVEVAVAVVRPAERPGDHGPPRRVRRLELLRALAVGEDRVHVAPAERRLEHVQARLDRDEAVRQRAVAEVAERARLRRGRAHVGLAPAQRGDPGAGQEQALVAVVGDVREPVVDGLDPAGVGVVHPRLRDQLRGLRERLGRDRVVDRLVGRAVLAVPLVGAPVQGLAPAPARAVRAPPAAAGRTGGGSGTSGGGRRAPAGTGSCARARRASRWTWARPGRRRTAARTGARAPRCAA